MLEACKLCVANASDSAADRSKSGAVVVASAGGFGKVRPFRQPGEKREATGASACWPGSKSGRAISHILGFGDRGRGTTSVARRPDRLDRYGRCGSDGRTGQRKVAFAISWSWAGARRSAVSLLRRRRGSWRAKANLPDAATQAGRQSARRGQTPRRNAGICARKYIMPADLFAWMHAHRLNPCHGAEKNSAPTSAVDAGKPSARRLLSEAHDMFAVDSKALGPQDVPEGSTSPEGTARSGVQPRRGQSPHQTHAHAPRTLAARPASRAQKRANPARHYPLDQRWARHRRVSRYCAFKAPKTGSATAALWAVGFRQGAPCSVLLRMVVSPRLDLANRVQRKGIDIG